MKHNTLISLLFTQNHIQETMISDTKRDVPRNTYTQTQADTHKSSLFKFMMDVAFQHMNMYVFGGRSSTEHFPFSIFGAL